MSRLSVFDMPFPLRGISRSLAYRNQENLTTPGAINVRPDENADLRTRGGMRPGIRKQWAEQLGISDNRPIRMLEQVRVVPVNLNGQWSENFDKFATGGPPWPGYDVLGGFTAQPERVAGGNPPSLGTLSNFFHRGFSPISVPGLDADNDHEIEIMIIPTKSPPIGHYSTYKLALRCSEATPSINETDTIVGELEFLGGSPTVTYNARLYNGTTLLSEALGLTIGAAANQPLPMSLKKTGTTYDLILAGAIVRSEVVATAAPGNRVGVGVYKTSDAIPRFNSLTVRFFGESAVNVPNRNYAVMSAYDDTLTNPGGGIWREKHDFSGIEGPIAINPYNLVPDTLLHATQNRGLMFIADHGVKEEATLASGTAHIQAGGLVLVDSAATFVTNDVIAVGDAVVISESEDETLVPLGVFRIESVDSETNITLADVGDADVPFPGGAGTLGSATDIGYRIERLPKVYNVNDDSFVPLVADPDTEMIYFDDETTLKGPVPPGCKLITLFRDRIVLAANPREPHIWFMARQGDPYDWFMGGDTDDVGRPISGNQADAGIIGEPITALINFNDDYLVFGCTDSLWVLVGEPAFGAQIDNLSDTIGVVSSNAWCRSPNGDLFILSRDGLYTLRSAEWTKPKSMSREKLPLELRNIDRDVFEVQMAYDVNERGVQVHLVPIDITQTRDSWWYDLDTDSWWQESLPLDLLPTSIMEYEADAHSKSAVLLGSRDGFIRRYDVNAEDDDGTEIASYVLIGPFNLAGAEHIDGLITEMTVVMGEEANIPAGSVTWELFVDDTPWGVYQQAVVVDADREPFATGTWGQGLSYKAHPRARGNVVMLRINGNDTPRRWMLERVTAVFKAAGKQRRSS